MELPIREHSRGTRAQQGCAMRALRCSLFFLALVVSSVGSDSPRLRADELVESSASPATRDQLFSELAADVAELERQGSILKRVVRLVRPNVVHIEAQRDSEPGRPPRDIDEAGSGVIVEREERHYVLTNRHVIKYSSLTNIHIRLADGRVIHPTQVWSDKATDIAIMAITAKDLVP